MIEYKHIDLAFDNRQILKDYSLKINKGEKVLLRAPSGKGKSSLVKMLLGFVQPDNGEILINETTLNSNTLKQARESICYVSQDVDLIDEKTGTLIEQIFSYKCNRNSDYSFEKLRVQMQSFQLDENILGKCISELSGGERQRIGLIICFLLNRNIWILDEVTSALDENLKEKVIQKVLTNDKTLLIISHDHQWQQNNIVRIVEW